MEEEDIQTTLQASKYSRVSSNGRVNSSKPEPPPQPPHNHPEHKGAVVHRLNMPCTMSTPATANGTGDHRLRQWPHSRIIRVSRASGGKDRHSKVWTAKGPRDRRVRLSVSTAIQFYDLQDRLGYDQPSKAVEWLIKAAAAAIDELPSLNSSSFPPDSFKQSTDEARAGNVLDADGDAEIDGDPGLGHNNNNNNNQLGGSVSKSGCSSNNSETSKGSGLSLSRSEIRVKARERARERTAKEKDKEIEPLSNSSINVNVGQHQQQHNVNTIAPTSSFTQLLTAGISNLKYENNAAGGDGGTSSPLGTRGGNQWLSTTSTTPMDYFGGTVGLISPTSSRTNLPTSGYHTGPIHVGGVSLAQVMTISSFGEHQNQQQQQQQHNSSQHHELQHQLFPFVADQHLLQVGNDNGNDYNLSFSISSSSTSSGGHHLGAGFNNNRGPLQSNSPSLLPYLQRFSATDGSSVPFFLGGAAVDNQNHQHQHHHHQQQHQFQPTGLHLCYGDTGWQSDQKGKGKS